MLYTKLILIGIIDMGSTGTRLNIFGYDVQKMDVSATNTNRIEKIKLVFTREYNVYGGLHTMNEEQIHEKIKYLKKYLNKYNFQKHKLNVYGTAGFRQLSQSEKIEKLNIIYNELKEFNISEFGIISGEYEGYMAYTALKYLLNRPDFIFIDMGGKSTQVVSDKVIRSYNIGFTNINKELGNVERIVEDEPIYISSYFVNNKDNMTLKEIKNAGLRRFLNMLGLKNNMKLTNAREIKGRRPSWALGMSIKFISEQV